MKKILNKLAIWLYNKTNKDKPKNITEILSGIMIVESEYIPKGTCLMGTGDLNKLKIYSVKMDIEKENK